MVTTHRKIVVKNLGNHVVLLPATINAHTYQRLYLAPSGSCQTEQGLYHSTSKERLNFMTQPSSLLRWWDRAMAVVHVKTKSESLSWFKWDKVKDKDDWPKSWRVFKIYTGQKKCMHGLQNYDVGVLFHLTSWKTFFFFFLFVFFEY